MHQGVQDSAHGLVSFSAPLVAICKHDQVNEAISIISSSSEMIMYSPNNMDNKWAVSVLIIT